MSPEGKSDHNRKSRAAPRIQLSVNFSSGRVEGTGLIQNLSLTGIQIRLPETSGQPAVNAMIDLWFFIGGYKEPVSARGRVVRSSPNEFAVEFVRIDKKIQGLLLAITKAVAD